MIINESNENLIIEDNNAHEMTVKRFGNIVKVFRNGVCVKKFKEGRDTNFYYDVSNVVVDGNCVVIPKQEILNG